MLSILGVAGLIFALIQFLNGGSSARHIREIIGYGVLGVVFFMAGISLIRTTRDKPS